MRLAHLPDTDNQVAPFADAAGFATADELIAAGPGAWDAARAAAAGIDEASFRPLAEVRLDAPLRRPSKIACIGLNYADHIRETGLDAPRKPLVFAKFPNALCGEGSRSAGPPG